MSDDMEAVRIDIEIENPAALVRSTGLNLRIDPVADMPVDAGPAPAAVAS